MSGMHVGWRYAPAQADPGPPPARPAAEPEARLDPGWMDAQRRITRRLTRPSRLGWCGSVFAVAVLGGAWLSGLIAPPLLGAGLAAAAAGGAACGRASWQARRRLGAAIDSERRRVAAIAAAQAARLAEAQRSHGAQYRAWHRRRELHGRQAAWFAISLPAGIDRLDVAGGTLAGWSALVTTIGASTLSAGGAVTVVDLTEGGVAGDLMALAQRSGLTPLVWVLPADLARLDLGTGLGAEAMADMLAIAARASAERSGPDLAADCALLERVLGLLGPEPMVCQLTALLRVLGQLSDPRQEVASGLITGQQADQAGRLYGQGAGRLVIERAWALESRLRRLDRLGTAAVPLPPSRLRIACLDRRSGVIGNATIGTYLVAAMTHALRQAPDGKDPWAHVLVLLGAERLAAEVLDRLTSACETSAAGLVLGYRSIPAQVRERLGRGNAATAFMRLGNGEDARAASEQIGTEHRFVIGQLTDTVGASVTDTWGGSYTSTVGTADSAADSLSVSRSSGGSRGRGGSRPWLAGPFGDVTRSSSRDASYSVAESDSVSLTKSISTGTSWGMSLSRALGESASLGRTAQRSREFLVEAAELQRLPVTAAIVCYPCGAGRSVQLVDVNPALAALAGGEDA